MTSGIVSKRGVVSKTRKVLFQVFYVPSIGQVDDRASSSRRLLFCSDALILSVDVFKSALHAFFYKEPISRPNSKSSLISDIFLSNSSTKSSLIIP